MASQITLANQWANIVSTDLAYPSLVDCGPYEISFSYVENYSNGQNSASVNGLPTGATIAQDTTQFTLTIDR